MGIGKALGVAAAVLSLATAACAAPDEARIAQGALRGVIAGDVVSFKGIPFAAPPVGALRWRAPQAPPHWDGVRDASAFGPSCMQMSNGGNFGAVANQSEDCLTLNVFAPANRPAGAKLPVMVWIYGGAFTQGGSARYDGTSFARDGVVYVSLNYRLGRLGFFAHPALARTSPDGALADFGLADQIAALKWVRANISAFGGDPDNVTIFGESAGGISVNFLMIAKPARGLFNRAISESGFGRSRPRPLADAQKIGADFIETLGVTGDDAAAAKAMRALSAQQLSRPNGGIGDPTGPGPIQDGVIVTEDTGQGFADGDQARVPYLAGGNSFEASLFRSALTNPEGVLGRLPHRDAALALYGGGDPAKAAAAITTFATVIEPDRYLARQQARAGQPAYVYYFSYLPQSLRPTAMGVMHGGEIFYVFQMLPTAPIDRGPFHFPAATPDDEKIARSIHAYWVAFAKTGDPGSAGGPRWPQAGADDTVLEFGDDGPVVRPHFDAAELDPLTAVADANGGAAR